MGKLHAIGSAAQDRGSAALGFVSRHKVETGISFSGVLLFLFNPFNWGVDFSSIDTFMTAEYGAAWVTDFLSWWPVKLAFAATALALLWRMGGMAVAEQRRQGEETRASQERAAAQAMAERRKALDLPIRLSASAAFALELSAYRSFIDRSRVEIERAIAAERDFWSSAQTWFNHSAPRRLDPAVWRREAFNFFDIPAPPAMTIVQPNTDTKKVGTLTTIQHDYDPQANGPLLTAMNANIKAVEKWVSDLETAYKAAFQQWAAERDQLNKRLAAYE